MEDDVIITITITLTTTIIHTSDGFFALPLGPPLFLLYGLFGGEKIINGAK